MSSDVDKDKPIRKVADILRNEPAGRGRKVLLDRELQKLAGIPNLDPKEAASQVAQLLQKSTWQMPRVFIYGVAVIFIVSVVMMGVIFVPNLLDRFGAASIERAETPAHLQLTVDKINLPADGTSKTRIQVTVLDSSDQPVPDGTEIEFEAIHPDQGTIQPKTIVTKGGQGQGQAQTVYRAGTVPGEVQIIARAGPIEGGTVIHLTEPARPILNIGLRAEPNQKVRRGDPITFISRVENKGNAPATEITVFNKIPDGTVFSEASQPFEIEENGRLVIWQIEKLPPGHTAEHTLTVTVAQNQPVGHSITSPDCWVEHGGGRKVQGQESVSIIVEETAVAPAAITLLSNPSTLPADGKSTASILIRVLDESGTPVTDTVLVTFAPPPDMGTVEPIETTTTNGEASVTFTAGLTSGVVNVVATAGQITESTVITLTQALVKRGKLKNWTHLFSDPVEDQKNIIIFQLPEGTPIELLDKVEQNFREVAIAVWLPKDVIDEQQSTITEGSRGRQVNVGDDPEGALNSKARREIQAKAEGVSVQVLDNSRPDLVRVRVLGWMRLDSIEEGE